MVPFGDKDTTVINTVTTAIRIESDLLVGASTTIASRRVRRGCHALVHSPVMMKRHSTILATSLIVMLSPIEGFLPDFPARRRLIFSINAQDLPNDMRSSQPGKPQTLYDLIGGNPSDTQEVLKRRYTSLVKKLHPDMRQSRPDGGNLQWGDLSEINAAWQILGDPRERRKYDRELAAKGFADGFENIVEFGITKAIPWLAVKAEQTAEVAQQSAEAVNKGATQAQKAYAAYEMEQNSRQLEQRARNERERAKKLLVEADKLARTDPKFLSSLSASEAARLASSFQIKPPPSLQRDIEALKQQESTYNEAMSIEQKASSSLSQAERQVNSAVRTRDQAQDNLEQAEKALAKARVALTVAKKEEVRAVHTLQTRKIEAESSFIELQKAQERVAKDFRQHEFIEREAQVKSMRIQSQELEASAAESRDRALDMKQRALEQRRDLN